MSITIVVPRQTRIPSLHTLRVAALAFFMLALTAVVAWYGFNYYTTPVPERPFHDLHPYLRPSGRIGLRLGIFAAVCFLCLYCYPVRKRWKWLQTIGKTRNWLDMHVLFGLSVPVLVTLHSSLKLNGLAGMAYWIMWAIVMSGIVGRYLYSQIPRSASAAELTLQELEQQAAELESAIRAQSTDNVDALFTLPSRDEVAGMSLPQAGLTMLALDLKRPFQIARLRRAGIRGSAWRSLGGLLPSGNTQLEEALRLLQKRSWLMAKILFLNRSAEIFHLWHVVHRPFSWSFLVLVGGHIVLVGLMGYF